MFKIYIYPMTKVRIGEKPKLNNNWAGKVNIKKCENINLVTAGA